MSRGCLAIVLHAHLPYVRHPELDEAIEEHWLFEALTETYIPLIIMLRKLREDGVRFRLTLSITPTLMSMLQDPLLRYRYIRRLERLIDLASKEIVRTKNSAANDLSREYWKRFLAIRNAYVDEFDRDLLSQFKELTEDGGLEIMASAATHAYLPHLVTEGGAIKAQVRTGIDAHAKVFGKQPMGFWLPECGYCPELDHVLDQAGIGYTILETHGVTRCQPQPPHGIFQPIRSACGLAFFGRDPESSRQVWSAGHGYPGHPAYREFYRDLAFDLDFDYLHPCIPDPDLRVDSGLKYHRITSAEDGEAKEWYDPMAAMERAHIHAKDFLDAKMARIRDLAGRMDTDPLIVAPFDAELFGHWWYEGVDWLDLLIRRCHVTKQAPRLVGLGEYLQENPPQFEARPLPSSWGANGHGATWLNEKNDWLYPHLHHGARSLAGWAATSQGSDDPLRHRLLQQAGRELLLAQASDWSFMISRRTAAGYGETRAKTHLRNLNRLLACLEQGSSDKKLLRMLESRNAIFPDLGYDVFMMDSFKC